jgi:hypothetical protein
MRVAVTSIYFVLACGLLMVTFRIDEEFKNFRTSRSTIIASYVSVAAIMTIVSLWVAPLAGRLFTHEPPGVRTLAVGLLSFVCLFIVAILFGPVGLDIPGSGLRGIFFAEWEFVRFLVYDALPMSIIGALLHWWSRR